MRQKISRRLQEVITEGNWRLTRVHQLQIRRTGLRKEIVLSGPITRAEPLGLSFRVAETSIDEGVVGRELALRGRWQADSKNRLNFLVDRRQGRSERLTLQGGWELNSDQEVVYRWQTEADGGRRIANRLIRFQGAWEVGEDKRLVYVLDRSSDSGFRFSGSFQTPSILPKKGALRYQLGLELSGPRRLRVITLFGKWKASDRWGLSFEIPWTKGRVRSIDFGASYRLGRSGSIVAELRTRQGEPLGVEVTLTREFQKGQGEAFLRLRRSLEESAVEGGLRFQW